MVCQSLGTPGSDNWPLAFRRAAALQEGLRQAVAVPLALAETVASLWPALQELALCGNLACRSDLQVRGGGSVDACGHHCPFLGVYWTRLDTALHGRRGQSQPQGRLAYPLLGGHPGSC